MIIAGTDTETTGLLDADHRIIEAYVGLWRPNGEKIFSYDQRIDPQRGISADAQRVHGITLADLVGKPNWDEVGPKLHKVLSKADLYVWHNGDGFDGPFLDMEFKRIGLSLPERPTVDTMLNGVWATHDGKKPTLQELCFACGIEYDPLAAHAAAYDVDVMMQAFFLGVQWGYFDLPAEGLLKAA